MWSTIFQGVRHIIPQSVFSFFWKPYHWTLALTAAIWHRFPSRKIKVIAVTGTKGKSSVVEILNAILEEAGHVTALTNTIRFKIGAASEDNMYKMSMPGRFFMQRFLRKSVDAGCTHAIIEMTSQGALLYRHRWIQLDALIFTNLAPEHIEAHGSFEDYVRSKLRIADALGHSKKRPRVLVVNKHDAQSEKFLTRAAETKLSFDTEQVRPFEVRRQGVSFTFEGTKIESPLSGIFNIENMLAAAMYARTEGISVETIVAALTKFSGIRGRVERIEEGQDFNVIVDYAHTPDSLQKLYDVFQQSRRICVLGNTGGGRDVWKRDEMAKIADNECDEIILTNEDPYNDDPMKIIEDMAGAMESRPTIIIDRRQAIAKALSLAQTGDSVLITGKGTDPYIMGPNGTKEPWDDARVAREELAKLRKSI